MKTPILILSILLSSPIFATSWRVNNNDVSANFSTIQEAVENFQVIDGDTLYIEGSPLEYSGANINKRLVLIGPGYFLTQNPETPANGAEALIGGDLNFEGGSEGSVLIGVTFVSINDEPTIFANNIRVSQCNLSSGGIRINEDVNNITISQNYTRDISVNINVLATNLIITNNIILEDIDLSSSTQVDIFENNVLLGDEIEVSATFFRNNILTTESDQVEISSSNLSNNVSTNAQLGTENGNIVANPALIFIGQTNGTTDGQYQLAPDSPAQGAGFEGTDCGVFGGTEPYALSGLGNIPVITDLRVPTEASFESGLPIQVKARSF